MRTIINRKKKMLWMGGGKGSIISLYRYYEDWWISLLTIYTRQDSVESTDLPEIRVYKRRWYILGLFGLLACHQCVVWNPFGPIESAVQYAYHWSNAEVRRVRVTCQTIMRNVQAPMLANWGCIMFVITSIPLTKLAEVN